MAKKPKTALDSTVKAQLASLTLTKNSLEKENQTLSEENKALKKQNVQLANVIENDLKAEVKVRILAMSGYKESDLEDLPIEQLQQIEETLSKAKGAETASYKSIRAGGASEHAGHLTVGSLYQKSRKEILESEGEF